MAIRFQPTPVAGCVQIRLDPVSDARGSFLKLFQLASFREISPAFEIRECFTSTSVKGAIRGFHFQAPPHDHDKVVVCQRGKIFDVILDLRRSERTYGQAFGFELDGARGDGLFVPRGCAHGFQSRTDDGTLIYLTSSEYAPTADQGIRWDSLSETSDLKWPLEITSISDRDRGFPKWSEFRSPFP